MRLPILALPILAALASHAVADSPPRTDPVRETFLAGGALAVCSDLASRACRTPPAGGRSAPTYRIDAAAIRAAMTPGLWTAPDAPRPETIAALLKGAQRVLGERAIDASTLEGALAAVCLGATCHEGDVARPWSMLLDTERAALLAALQQPEARDDGERVRERAHPAASTVAGGVRVLEAFVAAARARAADRRPRIAFVTAAAFDPMEPVDFYRSLFEALGAEATWWPVDPALAAARFEAGDCEALPRLRAERLRLARREVVFPDLASAQQAFCRAAVDALPAVDGVFFAGGDQWRLRQAFFGPGDRANPWLEALRAAHAAGRVVVGGTSAGAAVHSGAWMLANGSVAQAVAAAPVLQAPPEPGCSRGGRCGGVAEDALVLWTGGGLGLAADAIVDTHFSERARELRLLRAMQAAGARWGYGADETSALHLRESGTRREIRAIGERGGWVLHRPHGSADDGALAWYLVPGATLVVEDGSARLQRDKGARRARRPDAAMPASAFDSGALRALAQELAARCDVARRLPAGAAVAELQCQPDTRSWRGPGALDGVGPLRLRLVEAAQPGR